MRASSPGGFPPLKWRGPRFNLPAPSEAIIHGSHPSAPGQSTVVRLLESLMETPLQRQAVDSLVMRQHLERISEPWFLNKVVAMVVAFVMALVLGTLAASGQIEALILVAVWVIAVLIIVFVRDYWWSPALIITALSLSTFAFDFRLTGLEVGMVILGLTFPVKLAMKTLWPAKPKMDAGLIYWALVTFVAVHAVVILFYNKIEGVSQLKNIVKAYYGALAPLVLYGLLIRYCNPKTVFRTGAILFWTWIFTAIVAIIVILLGVEMSELTDLRITVDYIDSVGALGFLRSTGPYLFIGAIAFWPVARSTRVRFLLGFATVLSVAATLLSSGRVAFFSCFVAGAFFAVVRKRLWLALPVFILLALTAGICTLKPDILYSLPEQVQRSLTPLNFSQQKTQIQTELGESDRWHQELRTESLNYWNQDTTSFYLGHGFKPWDDSIVFSNRGADINVDFDTMKRFAIEMGRTENSFSSVTNIFGLAGLVLYGAFLIQMAWRLWKGRRLSPEGSVERAICEFSFVNLVTYVMLAPLSGGVPGILLIYWALGVLAARPYLGVPEPAKPAPAPLFDRSRQVDTVRSAPFRGDPLADFSKRQSRFPAPRRGPAGG